MVRQHLAARDITDRRVLAAMAWVPRERFVPAERLAEAYADRPLHIGHGQTISQPYIVALMTQAAGLTRRSRVLEVGTGSGYHAAVIARLAREVWSLERVATLGIRTVHAMVGDGTFGYPPAAPFDAVVVAAAASAPPPALLRQLAPGGRLVIPVGPPDVQELLMYERGPGGVREHVLCACCFVPLIGAGHP
jgi:protein-L-isoaspartate(D-aspartate) O-methyltransferase